jgi:hypothetical protein
VIPPSAVPGFARDEPIKALRVTISRRFSVAQHFDAILAECAQTLFALCTLDRQHGMPHIALRAVFQATVVNKISYAASAWWGYASAADHDRLKAFVWLPRRLGPFTRAYL